VSAAWHGSFNSHCQPIVNGPLEEAGSDNPQPPLAGVGCRSIPSVTWNHPSARSPGTSRLAPICSTWAWADYCSSQSWRRLSNQG
jgi:hypothetical protein